MLIAMDYEVKRFDILIIIRYGTLNPTTV